MSQVMEGTNDKVIYLPTLQIRVGPFDKIVQNQQILNQQILHWIYDLLG